MLRALSVLLATSPGPSTPAGPPPAKVVPFRTEVAPRIDPVFGDISSLRRAVDEFLGLEAEMEKVRDGFSTAVHETLAQLAPPAAPRPKGCPPGVAPHYGRALEAGGRYLSLGRRLEAHFREIRRSDLLGDAVGLTPDYRWKVRQASELYQRLLRDYREMRVAFYDQLGAELKFAGCPIAAPTDDRDPSDDAPSNPANPAAWNLDPSIDPAGAPSALEEPTVPSAAKGAKARAGDITATAVGPAIWIDVDNAHCGQASRLFVDGASFGIVPAGKRLSVRTRSGPRELCVLPESDKRTCGDPGTVRRAYLYEGWTLTVRCEK
jgi:hypothetical protein